MGRTSNLPYYADEGTAILGNGATEGTPIIPRGRQAPGSIRSIAEREMNARLQRLEIMTAKETEILALREREAILALAVKEKELAIKEQELLNAKEVGDLKRRILEAELKMKEVMLQHMLKGKTP